MQISENGLKIIEQFERFRQCPYRDQIGVPTIGIGTTFYEDGKKVTMKDTCIAHSRAIELLEHYLINTENLIATHVKVPLTQNQFDALCSLDYNIGDGAFQMSTLLKKVDINPNDPSIRDEFNRWNRAGGHVLQDLVKRRAKEADLYFTTL